jgi:formate dehydrogenase maturation protein FdhE
MKTEKSYKNRFGNFKAGVCPYCGAMGAMLKKAQRGKERYIGSCPMCHTINNFTNPKCATWIEEL